jgi:hypothetical protein
MADDLDYLLGALARAPADHSLAGLESGVLRGVAESREARRALRALAPVHLAMVGVSVAIGLTAGGMAGLARPPAAAEPSILVASLSLAPSTLLAAE